MFGSHQHRAVDRQGEPVDLADELGDKAACRSRVDVQGAADLLDAAPGQHRDAVAQRHRLGLVVGHEDRGHAQGGQQLLELDAQGIAQLGVEGGQRFVEQQHRGFDGHRAGQRHALLLAAGEFIDPARAEAVKLHQPEQPSHACGNRCGRVATNPQAITNVAGDAHIGKQRVTLKHHADAALLDRQLGHILVVKADVPAGIGIGEPGDHAQERGLAAAGWAEQNQAFAGLDHQVERFQGASAAGEGLAAAGQGDLRGHGVSGDPPGACRDRLHRDQQRHDHQQEHQGVGRADLQAHRGIAVGQAHRQGLGQRRVQHPGDVEFPH